jgi:hypothetical protein
MIDGETGAQQLNRKLDAQLEQRRETRLAEGITTRALATWLALKSRSERANDRSIAPTGDPGFWLDAAATRLVELEKRDAATAIAPTERTLAHAVHCLNEAATLAKMNQSTRPIDELIQRALVTLSAGASPR